MTIAQATVAACFILLGLVHSILGETDIIRPLFAAEWKIDTPRWATERILRFAWHLTSVTWFAVAALTLGVDLFPTVGIAAVISAAMVFVLLRGHLAWPLFLLAGLAAFHEAGWLTNLTLQVASGLTVAALGLAALLHVYWAAGGTWMLDQALPEVEGRDFSPGPVLTLAVALALASFAALVGLAAFVESPAAIRWLTIAGVVVLGIRAIGDGKVVGFTKAEHGSTFGRADDQYFTPLITFLALGATAALLL